MEKIKVTMNDKESLQEIVFMVNNHINKDKGTFPQDFVAKLVEFLEENVIHTAMDNNYK